MPRNCTAGMATLQSGVPSEHASLGKSQFGDVPFRQTRPAQVRSPYASTIPLRGTTGGELQNACVVREQNPRTANFALGDDFLASALRERTLASKTSKFQVTRSIPKSILVILMGGCPAGRRADFTWSRHVLLLRLLRA